MPVILRIGPCLQCILQVVRDKACIFNEGHEHRVLGCNIQGFLQGPDSLFPSIKVMLCHGTVDMVENIPKLAGMDIEPPLVFLAHDFQPDMVLLHHQQPSGHNIRKTNPIKYQVCLCIIRVPQPGRDFIGPPCKQADICMA